VRGKRSRDKIPLSILAGEKRAHRFATKEEIQFITLGEAEIVIRLMERSIAKRSYVGLE
jgi:hypothetical protein